MFGLRAFATPSGIKAPIGHDDISNADIAHAGRMWRRAIVRFNALVAQDWPKPGRPAPSLDPRRFTLDVPDEACRLIGVGHAHRKLSIKIKAEAGS